MSQTIHVNQVVSQLEILILYGSGVITGSIFFGTSGKVDIGPSISCVKSNISFICYLKSSFGSDGVIHYKGLDMCVCFPMETQSTPQARQAACAN